MWAWIATNAEPATAVFTLLAAIATLLAVVATLLTVYFSARGNAHAVRRNTEISAAKWIFDAHMKLNEDARLAGIFYQLKYNSYVFNCDAPHPSDLNTEKERDLVYFLDFLNSVDAALRKNLVTINDLNSTTIGFAIQLANHSEQIDRFMKFTMKRDEQLRLPTRAWGAMHEP